MCLAFAILGTLVSTIVVAIVLQLAGVVGWISTDTFGGLHSAAGFHAYLIFAALLGSTDPVATLSVLSSPQVNADAPLQAILCESVLNDAVAIVRYQTLGDEEAQEVLPSAGPKKYWTRHGLAVWLMQELDSRVPTIVGIDHAFSFPMRYFERHRLAPDWSSFLDDFCAHWPTDEPHTYVDFVRYGHAGNGTARMGGAEPGRVRPGWAGPGQTGQDGPGSARVGRPGPSWARPGRALTISSQNGGRGFQITHGEAPVAEKGVAQCGQACS